MAVIYGLYDAAGDLRYIGKANDPARRLSRHMRDVRRRDTPLYRWIRKNGTPEMRVLEECDDWREAERRLIAQSRENGDRLLNLADGGDEPFCPPEVRSANGHALAARIAADPAFARYRYLKRQLSSALHRGQLMNKTREKMRAAARMDPHLFGEWANIPDREENDDGSPLKGYA